MCFSDILNITLALHQIILTRLWVRLAPSDDPDWRPVWTFICPNYPALWGVCRHDLMYTPSKQGCILNLHVFMCVFATAHEFTLTCIVSVWGGEINKGNFCWRQGITVGLHCVRAVLLQHDATAMLWCVAVSEQPIICHRHSGKRLRAFCCFACAWNQDNTHIKWLWTT